MNQTRSICHLIKSNQELLSWRNSISSSNAEARIGFVPTMGALHRGHGELLKQARAENDFVVMSIFVNPTQFNDKKDFEKYPIELESDLQLARELGVDLVFTPTFTELYPDNYRYKLSENEFSLQLCGKNRPGHFDGVLSVVLKLFNLIRPTQAYFGEKDFQQLQLIQGMVQAFFLPITIRPVGTVRENDGLAMSSRNNRLNAIARQWAPTIYRALKDSPTLERARQLIEETSPAEIDIKIDYLEQLADRRFVAVQVNDVRLIDNVRI